MKKTAFILALVPALALFGILGYVIFSPGGDEILGPNTVAYTAGALVVILHLGAGYAAYRFFARAAERSAEAAAKRSAAQPTTESAGPSAPE